MTESPAYAVGLAGVGNKIWRTMPDGTLINATLTISGWKVSTGERRPHPHTLSGTSDHWGRAVESTLVGVLDLFPDRREDVLALHREVVQKATESIDAAQRRLAAREAELAAVEGSK